MRLLLHGHTTTWQPRFCYLKRTPPILEGTALIQQMKQEKGSPCENTRSIHVDTTHFAPG